MSEPEPKKPFFEYDYMAPPAIPLSDPERERKVREWQDFYRREEIARRRRNLDLEEKK